MTTATFIHHSERWDRPLARVKRDATEFRKVGHAVTRTEMDPANRNDVLRAPHWSFCQTEERASREMHAEWSNDRFSLSGMPYAYQLTNMDYPMGGGKVAPKNFATVTILQDAVRVRQRFAIVNCHMPLDNTPERAKVWIDCAKGLVRLVKKIRKEDPAAKIILVADWNKNLRQKAERDMIQKHVCDPLDLRIAWDGFIPAKGNTHGSDTKGQIIDGWLVDKSIKVQKVWLLPDTDGSDHRPCAMRISY